MVKSSSTTFIGSRTTYYIDFNLPLGDCIFYANNRRRNGEDRLSKIKDFPNAICKTISNEDRGY